MSLDLFAQQVWEHWSQHLGSRGILIPDAAWETLLPGVFSFSPRFQFPAAKESPKLRPLFLKRFLLHVLRCMSCH